jgi:hypothetical protein
MVHDIWNPGLELYVIHVYCTQKSPVCKQGTSFVYVDNIQKQIAYKKTSCLKQN